MIGRLSKSGASPLLFLPLYPVFSVLNTRSCLHLLHSQSALLHHVVQLLAHSCDFAKELYVVELVLVHFFDIDLKVVAACNVRLLLIYAIKDVFRPVALVKMLLGHANFVKFFNLLDSSFLEKCG